MEILGTCWQTLWHMMVAQQNSPGSRFYAVTLGCGGIRKYTGRERHEPDDSGSRDHGCTRQTHQAVGTTKTKRNRGTAYNTTSEDTAASPQLYARRSHAGSGRSWSQIWKTTCIQPSASAARGRGQEASERVSSAKTCDIRFFRAS